MNWIREAGEFHKYDNTVELRVDRHYGSEIPEVEISWSSAGIPRPTVAQVKKFIASLQLAVMEAEDIENEIQSGTYKGPEEE